MQWELIRFSQHEVGVLIAGRLSLEPIAVEFDAKYEYICNDGENLVIQTNYKAPLFKLVIIPLAKPQKVGLPWHPFCRVGEMGGSG